MRRALAVADQALFVSSPNPRVGCVLVRDGRWLAEGSTQRAGGRHAEAQALHEARHDEMTGLPNRTYFISRLEQELKARGRRKGRG